MAYFWTEQMAPSKRSDELYLKYRSFPPPQSWRIPHSCALAETTISRLRYIDAVRVLLFGS